MVVKKCVKCKKSITKKVPGLECSRCETIVHADPVCSQLSNKQLLTVKNSPNVEWSCQQCLKNISRRSSFVIPEDDDNDDDIYESESGNPQLIDAKNLVQDISREVKKTFREEIRNLEGALEFVSEQLSTMEQTIKVQGNRIKELENQNYDLINKNKNMELRVTVMEQELKEIEQKSLSNSIEVAGLPETTPGEISSLIATIASKLNVDSNGVQSTQRLPGSKEKPGSVLLEMKSKMIQQQWIGASKDKHITVGLVVPDVPKENADKRIYIREALTKYQKTLLYNAKVQLLNKSCQYVWCKNGKVFARKNNNSKIYYIRSKDDINQIIKINLTQSNNQPSTSL